MLLLAGCGSEESSESERSAAQASEPTEQQQSAETGTSMDQPAETQNAEAEPAQPTEEAMAEPESAEPATAGDDNDPCTVTLEVGDSIAYSRNSISVPSTCGSVTVNLTHTGTLPKEAMGHNWVLVPSDALQDIGQAGMDVGPQNDYVPDDDRIVAATGLVGGGQSTSVTFSLADLEAGTAYSYLCTFPGHWSVMRGTFTVE
ncbi:MAG: azurin [Xanthomonadales bacterium]|nr:azurin [Xanthomonadales bacterium]